MPGRGAMVLTRSASNVGGCGTLRFMFGRSVGLVLAIQLLLLTGAGGEGVSSAAPSPARPGANQVKAAGPGGSEGKAGGVTDGSMPVGVVGGELSGTVKIVSSLPRSGSAKGLSDTLVN